MKTKAMLAMVIAAIMVIAIVPLGLSDNDADGTVGGAFNLYVYTTTTDDDGDEIESWVSATGTGYNAYIALMDSTLSSQVEASDSSYTTTSGYYTNINPSYGTITKFNGTENSTDSWNVYYYSDVQESWIAGNTNALGFYKPYQDYDSEFRTANIALFYGTPSNDQINALPTTGLQSLIDVQGVSAYRFTFHILSPTGDKPDNVATNSWSYYTSHIGTYYGYGSDASLALKDAISSTIGVNNVWNYANDAVNYSYYGQFTSMFGVEQQSSVTTSTSDDGTVTHTGIYDSYAVYAGSSTGTYTSFMLGFYTASDAGIGMNVNAEFAIVYEHNSYTW